jgi:phage terminase large subunit
MSKRYRMTEGGMHDKFMQSRAKVQFIGGGYGNGKTAAVCVKALRLCKDYPGCNGLIARSTYPRLNDTIRREFFLWCPKEWIKRMPTRDDNTCVLKNGTTINFRYVAQRGSGGGEETKSNLLSATYDWMIVDQIEDPEFSHKDFMDLLGRLRGDTPYVGDDSSMPVSGPRWFMVTSNPTRNWVFRELVRPLHNFHKGIIDPALLCEVGNDGKALVIDGKPRPIIDLIEGSTYENIDNVGQDYINTMLASYTGSMRQRFVFGEWGALEGLVYPQFDESIHVLSDESIRKHVEEMRYSGFAPSVLEAYDHGIASPSCYLLSLVDDDGNVIVVDGFYEKEQGVVKSAERIRAIREEHEVSEQPSLIYADPQVFRRTTQSGKSVGATVSALFQDEGITMQRGANDINSGIAKVQQYLSRTPRHEHPLYGMPAAPYLYFSDKLTWLINEMTEYYWQHDSTGVVVDKPVDRNDHAMDALKYLLTSRPRLARFTGRPDAPPAWMSWQEAEKQERTTLPRHR